MRCEATYPGAVTLHGKPVRCELAAGHPGEHGHSFAARYWNDPETLCAYESGKPGTLLCVLPLGHAGSHETPFYACPFEAIDADECAMLRERSVAGVSNDVPACPVHGAYPVTAR